MMRSRPFDKPARLANQVFDGTDEHCPSMHPGAESACMAAGSLAGGASMPASSSGPSADAEDLYYDPAGGTESFLSTHSLGHSSTMSVDSFASAQSADRVSPLSVALRYQACKNCCLGCLTLRCERSVCQQGEFATWSLVPPGLQEPLSGVLNARHRCPDLWRAWLSL